jgi:hypothetical protein
MANSSGGSQAALVGRLNYLLQQAREVKSSSSVDPPLQVSELVPEKEPILGDLNGDEHSRNLAVEGAARTLFYANLVCICCPTDQSVICLLVLGIYSRQPASFCHHMESP